MKTKKSIWISESWLVVSSKVEDVRNVSNTYIYGYNRSKRLIYSIDISFWSNIVKCQCMDLFVCPKKKTSTPFQWTVNFD